VESNRKVPHGVGVAGLRSRLARTLRAHRKARGWTQEEAAERAHLNPRLYQKLEQGEVNTTLRTLERLAQAYEVDVRTLF
jgi:transcriptional regulator with XRE-family HTH domain